MQELKDEQRTCIIGLDSLSMHDLRTIAKNLRAYLYFEREAKVLKTSAATTSQPLAPSTHITDSNSKAKRAEKERENFLKKHRFDSFNKQVEAIPCKVPMQRNGYDCGVFVIKFTEMILSKWPSSTSYHIQNKFTEYVSPEEFTQEDITQERVAIRELLEE